MNSGILFAIIFIILFTAFVIYILKRRKHWQNKSADKSSYVPDLDLLTTQPGHHDDTGNWDGPNDD
jgi:hypothetical protein